MDGLKMKYFVLNPNKQDVYGTASRTAMRAYANIIKHENSELANNLVTWADRITSELIVLIDNKIKAKLNKIKKLPNANDQYDK